MEANIINAIGTSVIALATVVGVSATLTYYFVEIVGMKIPIIILMDLSYIIVIGLFIKYIISKIK